MEGVVQVVLKRIPGGRINARELARGVGFGRVGESLWTRNYQNGGYASNTINIGLLLIKSFMRL